MKLATPLMATLEVGLNRYLGRDPTAVSECEQLIGRSMAVHLRELDLTLQVVPVRGGLALTQDTGEASDVRMDTSVPASLRLLAARPEQRQAMIASGQVRITGDVQLADRLFRILRRVDFDPEELVASVLGDVAGHRVGVLVRGLLAWGSRAGATLGVDTVEYLREETHDLAHGADVAEWMDAVDTLGADVERLAARVRRVERRRLSDA